VSGGELKALKESKKGWKSERKGVQVYEHAQLHPNSTHRWGGVIHSTP
jgi:hypothetical protein